MRTKIPKIVPQNNPDRPIEVVFNYPIGQIDTVRLVLLEDTLKKQVLPTVFIDVLRPNVLKINYKWKENIPYQLLLPNLTIFDFHQIGNDTIVLNYLIKERKTFGNLTATAEGLEPETAYIIQILTKDNQVVEEFYTKGKAIASQKFLSLSAQEYKLRLIIDTNDNQRWDTGNYPTSQPERVVISDTLTNLRENWELDLKILLNAE